MKFQLKSIIPSIAFLLATVKADDTVKLFTSDGVVYSYAVVTSTIAPPSVRVETHWYTTTRVREITLADSEVQTTTERIVSASESTSSIESSYTSTSTTSPSSSLSDTQTAESRTTSTLEPASVVSLTTSTGHTTPSSSSTSSSKSSFQQPSSSTTSTQSITSLPSFTTTSLDSSYTAYSTVTGSDGKCSVYYDDDEYYSTLYLTDSNQSVDAATTITSTKLVYETLTLA